MAACTDSSQALNIFAQNPDKFRLVIADYTMPGMTGIALAEHILNMKRAIHIVSITFFCPSFSLESRAREKGFARFMKRYSQTSGLQTVHPELLPIVTDAGNANLRRNGTKSLNMSHELMYIYMNES